MTIPLSRSFTCRFGAPVIDRVDPRIFQLTYFGKCMDCTFCQDACCQYGADIDLQRMAALQEYQQELEQYLGVPHDEWFRLDPEDCGVLDDEEYPSGQYTRTQVVELPAGRSPHNEWACVFLDPKGRGCRIHRFALERGIQVHEIKPMVCLLFPVSFTAGELIPAYEFTLEDELVCQGPGDTLYESARSDIEWYFGSELVKELDELNRVHRLPSHNNSGLIPLRTCTA
jgi:Fe-S-cluster containining protein